MRKRWLAGVWVISAKEVECQAPTRRVSVIFRLLSTLNNVPEHGARTGGPGK